MNNLSSIICTLSQEDKKNFVAGLKKRNKRNDTKNIELFKLLDTDEPLEHPDLVLYGKSAKGAYHALCKRLHDALINFIASKRIEEESSKEMNALKLILVSRSFFQHQQVSIAFKTLARAELIAKKYSLYNTLNEVYQLQLGHAHLTNSVDFQEILKKFERNKRNIVQEENLNLFYAAIQDELTRKNPVISDIIERNLNLYQISITKNLSYQSLFKILQISNQVANVTRNYYEILKFIEKARKKIEVSKRVYHEDLYDHIQILYYLSNTYFRIKKFEKSAISLRAMHDHMQLQNLKYFDIFYCQYLLIENLLNIYTGNLEMAIQKLQTFDFKKYRHEEVYIHDLKLTLVVALFLNQQFNEALKVYRDFYHSDSWYTKRLGFIWVIKKNLLEILVLMELDYMDLVESRLKSFRKKYSSHLIEHDEKKILDYVNLIAFYYNNQQSIHSKQFEKKLGTLLNIDSKEEDIFAISFYAWLISKVKSENTYSTCLEYLNTY
ncbi:hypothetical protein [Lutimonas sp.]|uniref:hypothetical protein n=1 Tax=Lutimonas sp. TaxID=1872403 RepID=UPI003C78D941